jgi:hypothetical protein
MIRFGRLPIRRTVVRNAIVMGFLLGAASIATPARAQQISAGALTSETRLCTTVRHAALVEAAANPAAFRFRDAFERLCLPESAPRPLRAELTPDHCAQADSEAPVVEINNSREGAYWRQERARCRGLVDPPCPDFIRFGRAEGEKAGIIVNLVRGDSGFAYDDHGHLLGVYLERLPRTCQATIEYSAAAAAEWLVDFPADRAVGYPSTDEILQTLSELLSQFAAEEAIVRAATNARDIELQARREEVMATLRADRRDSPDPERTVEPVRG